MPNRSEHEFFGALFGMAASCSSKEDPGWLANPVTGALLGKAAGRLPDIIEPALSPHHRKLFHSWAVFAGMGLAVKAAYDWQPEEEYQKTLRWIAIIAGAGYLSHLLLDSLTKRSLPLV